MARYEYARDREYIRFWINQRGFSTMSDFAKACGISRQNLSGFMSGIFNPDIHTLIKMATVARCDLDTITSLFYADEMAMHRQILKQFDNE